MSNPPSVLKPNPYFTGIIYNPTDFPSSSGVLTYAQASVLFIQKTIADSVTGITNFVNGITTSSILAKTISATCNLWTNAIGEINIGTLGGRSALIHIGDGNNNLSGSGVHINNGTNTASNVQILNGTGSTGTINLGSSTSTTNAAGIVNLGSTSRALTVNVPLTINYTPTTITGATQLGYNSITSANPTNACAVTDTVIRTISLTPGIWMVQGSMIWASVTLGQLYAGLSPNALIDNLSVTSTTGNGSNNPYVSVSRFAVIETNTTYNLIGRSFAGASTIQLSSLNAVRIA